MNKHTNAYGFIKLYNNVIHTYSLMCIVDARSELVTTTTMEMMMMMMISDGGKASARTPFIIVITDRYVGWIYGWMDTNQTHG